MALSGAHAVPSACWHKYCRRHHRPGVQDEAGGQVRQRPRRCWTCAPPTPTTTSTTTSTSSPSRGSSRRTKRTATRTLLPQPGRLLRPVLHQVHGQDEPVGRAHRKRRRDPPSNTGGREQKYASFSTKDAEYVVDCNPTQICPQFFLPWPVACTQPAAANEQLTQASMCLFATLPLLLYISILKYSGPLLLVLAVSADTTISELIMARKN